MKDVQDINTEKMLNIKCSGQTICVLSKCIMLKSYPPK